MLCNVADHVQKHKKACRARTLLLFFSLSLCLHFHFNSNDSLTLSLAHKSSSHSTILSTYQITLTYVVRGWHQPCVCVCAHSLILYGFTTKMQTQRIFFGNDSALFPLTSSTAPSSYTFNKWNSIDINVNTYTFL